MPVNPSPFDPKKKLKLDLDEKLQRLNQLAGGLDARRREALQLFNPLPNQEPFFSSKATVRIVRGGNRSGKSTCSMVELARALTGQDPHGKFPTNRPLLAYVIGWDLDHIGRVAYRLLFKKGAFDVIRDEKTGLWRAYDPATDAHRVAEKEPAPPLIPNRFIDQSGWAWENKAERIFSVCRFHYGDGHPMNGTELRAFGSKSHPAMGDPVDIVVIDEDLFFQGWVGEMEVRLSDRKGRMWWAAWPHSTNDALVRMSERAADQVTREKPDVQETVLRYSDNSFIDQDEKRKRIEGWSDEERRARDYGDFLTESVLMYPGFSLDIHGWPLQSHHVRRPDPIDVFLENNAGQAPLNWTRYMSVDPGHAVCAVIFAAVPPPEVGDFVVIEDMLYLRGCDAEKFAEHVLPKVSGKNYQSFIIDHHGGRATQIGAGVSVSYQYSESLALRNIRSRETDCGFLPGSDDVQGRANTVRSWLAIRPDGTTKLRIVSQTTKAMQEEFRLYKKKIKHQAAGVAEVCDDPVLRHNHAMNALEYLAAMNPKYVPPQAFDQPLSPGYRAYLEWRKNFERKHGGDFVNLGPPRESAV